MHNHSHCITTSVALPTILNSPNRDHIIATTLSRQHYRHHIIANATEASIHGAPPAPRRPEFPSTPAWTLRLIAVGSGVFAGRVVDAVDNLRVKFSRRRPVFTLRGANERVIRYDLWLRKRKRGVQGQVASSTAWGLWERGRGNTELKMGGMYRWIWNGAWIATIRDRWGYRKIEKGKW